MSVIFENYKLVCVFCRKLVLAEIPIVCRIFNMPLGKLQIMKVLLVWLIVCGIWGSNWIFIKFGLADLPPVSFAAWRLAVAIAILLLILAANKRAFPRDKRFWILAGATGVFNFFLNFALMFWGVQHISSGLAGVLQASIPVFGLVLAPFYLPDERITPRKVFAITLGIVGVGTIFYEQLNISGILALAGGAAIIVGSFFAAYAGVLTKTHGAKSNSTALLTAQMIIGFVPLALAGLIWEGSPSKFNWSWTAVFCVLYLALVGTIAAFWLYYWLLRNIEVTKAMTIALVTPLVAVLIGTFFGETLQRQTLAGGALILLSVGLIAFQPKKESAPQKTEEKLLNHENSELDVTPLEATN